MADEKNGASTVNDADKNTDGKENQGEQQKTEGERTFTRDELNKAIATEKNKAIEEAKKAFEAEKNEAEKLSKMKDEEKRKYELDKKEEENRKLQTELNAIKLKSKALDIIAEKQIPSGYVNIIDFSTMDAEKVNSIINEIEVLRNKDRETYLNSALKETPPKQKQTGGTEKTEIPSVF